VGIDVFPHIFVGICMKEQEWPERKIFLVLERSFVLSKNLVSWCAELIKRLLFYHLVNKTSMNSGVVCVCFCLVIYAIEQRILLFY